MSLQGELIFPKPTHHNDGSNPHPNTHPHSASPSHHDSLAKGFNMITVAAVFIGAIQAQIMSTTLDSEPDIAIRAINSFYLGGVMLDIASAVLAFLTARWLDRLSEDERAHLELEFCKQDRRRREGDSAQDANTWRMLDKLFYTWLAFSLFSPMPLLVLGVLCMVFGLFVFVWTQQHTIVASLFTLSAAAVVPMVLGDFFIGQDPRRRQRLIVRLSEMQGDW